MDFVSLLGTTGTILGLVRAVPQLIRLIRAREAYGVSLDTAATSSIVSFGWATYGLLSHQWYVVFATGSSGLIFAIITFLAIQFGRSVKEFKVAPLWMLVLFFAGALFGKSGLGVMLPISVLAANIPQLRVAYKERNLRDLSLGTWMLSISDGLVWGLYALMQHDISIATYGLFQLLTSGPIVLLKFLHLSKEKELDSDVASE
jgi:uncharacterized protein with PQ loop repeat